MPKPIVEITESGRAGSIHYREGKHTVTFNWEFALPPALALIFGTATQHWEANHPWAAGRQDKVYNFVAEEVVRQKAPGCACEIDLDSGTMTVLMGGFAKRTRSHKKFESIIVPNPEGGDSYDIAAIKRVAKDERKQLVEMLTQRGPVTAREVEALAAIDIPEAHAAIEAASNDHLSIDTRLAAAEVMNRDGRLTDLDGFLARQIRLLSNPANGLKRALELAARHPSETVKQALLYASYNSTECAPHCAGLLLTMTGIGNPPFDEQLKPILQKLDLHNSYFDRKAAFGELCLLVKMELDPNAAG